MLQPKAEVLVVTSTKRSAQPILSGDERAAIKKTLEEERQRAGFGNWAAFGARYEVAPQELVMFFNGKRNLSPTVALRLAQAFRRTDWEQRAFLRELAKRARIKNLLALPHESVADRILEDQRVKAAYVVSEPFVFTPNEGAGGPQGFAIDFFKLLAGFLGIQVDYIGKQSFQDLDKVFRVAGVDIIVSAVLPSFQRSRFMEFSRPLPFLRLPVSAVVRSANTLLNVKGLLTWDAAVILDPALKHTRFLLVEGEIGPEFAHTFLPGLLPGRIVSEKSLEPRHLYKCMTDVGGPDILIADMATCDEVRKQGSGVKPLPEYPDDPINMHMMKAFEKHARTPTLPALAVYPVVFGLPKSELVWKKLIDDAIEAVVTEGARPLLHLYERYLQSDPSFACFCTSDDENVSSSATRLAFDALFAVEQARYRQYDASNATILTTQTATPRKTRLPAGKSSPARKT